MRVVGGRLRGRRLTAPTDQATRPTSDRVRESLFNIIESRYRQQLIGGRVADLYAGTGALGIEALSRGAAQATFTETAPAALKVLRANLQALGLAEEASVKDGDAKRLLAALGPFDIIFLDPPYGGEEASGILREIATHACLSPDGLIILESAESDAVELPPGLEVAQSRSYGKTRVSLIFRNGNGLP